jgi:hypothetical protein
MNPIHVVVSDVKPELLEPKDLVLFLKEFFNFKCNNKERCLARYNEILKKIGQLNCASDVIDCIENEEDFSLRLYDAMDDVHLSSSSGLYLPFKFDYVPLDTYHKAYIEFADSLFSYLARCVNLNIHKLS